jgi:hypothetical protein
MFPDPTSKWMPYPSIIDGIRAPPFVLDVGIWRGVLGLIVLESKPGTRAYGVHVKCEAYAAFEEMIHSIAGHGAENLRYDGSVYIKEAETSQLLSAFSLVDPFKRKHRHFAFIGGDFCYQTLGLTEPIVHAFASRDEAYAWKPPWET